MRRLLMTFLALGAPALQAGEHVRIPAGIAPVRETVRLTLDPNADTYTGAVRIELDVRQPSASVTLHAEEMTVTRATVDGAEAAHAEGPDHTLVVTPARPLAPGRAVLTVDFRNEYDRRAVGLYKMKAGDEPYLFTQFEPADARKGFPCFDEPSFKIPWELSVVVPDGYDAVSNTPETVGPAQGGTREVRFAPTKPLPSYLVALAVGRFAFTKVEGMSVPGRIVSQRGQTGLAALAARELPPVLKALEEYFGAPYPYEKLDLIAVPEYWPGAMENPGAVTFAESLLLVDEKAAAPGQRRVLVRVIAHELAHMWFGDLVTMAWWDDLWLNESFADWLGDKIAEQLHPDLDVVLSELKTVQATMEGDRRASAQAIRRPVDDPGELLQVVGLVYYKGKSVLGMFERWMGPERFRDGVRAYMRDNAWKNATAAQFWKALDQAAGRDASTALATFIEQPGLPLVTVERLGGQQVRLTQQRFGAASLPPLSWKVPVALRYGDGSGSRVESVLLDAPTRVVSLPGGPVAWVFPAADGSGYYQWDLPAADMDDLAAHAATRLTPAERAAFVGNVAALLDVGRTSGARCLQVLAPFGADPHPEVLGAALAALGDLELPFADDATRPAFAAYLRATLGPSLDRIGMTPRAGEEPGVTTVRPQLMAWLGGHADDERVLRFADDEAARELATPGSVDPSLVAIVLALHAQRGDAALFDVYRQRVEAARTPADRFRYLSGIGGFRDAALRAKALEWSLSGTIRPNEMGLLVVPYRTTPAGRVQVFDWLAKHLDEIMERVPPVVRPRIISTASGCERERVERARTLFGKYEIPGGTDELAKVSEQVEACVALRARDGAGVAAWLRARP